MYGVKIYGRDKLANKNIEMLIPSLDYTFNDILLAIGSYVSNLYWAHTGIIYSFPESLSKEEYDSFNSRIQQYVLYKSDDSSLEYMHKGFIEKFGRYIYSEILDLAGYKDIDKLKTFDPSIDNMNDSEAIIYFRCLNAECWEIYAENLSVINLIKYHFKHIEEISL